MRIQFWKYLRKKSSPARLRELLALAYWLFPVLNPVRFRVSWVLCRVRIWSWVWNGECCWSRLLHPSFPFACPVWTRFLPAALEYTRFLTREWASFWFHHNPSLAVLSTSGTLLLRCCAGHLCSDLNSHWRFPSWVKQEELKGLQLFHGFLLGTLVRLLPSIWELSHWDLVYRNKCGFRWFSLKIWWCLS